MAYTALMIRIAIIVVAGALMLSCGGKVPKKQSPSLSLPTDDGVFVLRFNPCQCLLHKDELSTEIKREQGWERVALMAAEESEGIIRSLMSQMRNRPQDLYRVEGELLDRLVKWNGHHRSRVLRVSKINAIQPIGPKVRTRNQ